MSNIDTETPAPVLLKRLRQGVFSEQLAFTLATGEMCRLRPVEVSRGDAELLARWRREHREAFFSWVTPAADDTLRWLQAYSGRADDVLFVVLSPDGTPVGQMGVYDIDFRNGRAEFGRVIRGEKAPVDTMRAAVEKVLEISQTLLRLCELHLEVFENNTPAISLYRRCGFVESGKILYEMTFDEQHGVRWQPGVMDGSGAGEREHRWVLRMTKKLC